MSTEERVKVVGSADIPWKNGFLYVETKKDNKYGLPGGKVDPFEDLLVSVPREVSQEAGIEIVLNHLLGIWNFKSSRGSSVINIVYSGKIIEGKPKIIRPKEIEKIVSYNISQIREEYYKGMIRSGLANVRPVEQYLSGVRFPLNTVECLLER